MKIAGQPRGTALEVSENAFDQQAAASKSGPNGNTIMNAPCTIHLVIGKSVIGKSFIGKSFIGESFIGESFIGESFIGESFIGESFIPTQNGVIDFW